EISVVAGAFAQNSPIFKENANKQCMAICAYSVIFAKVSEHFSFTKEDISHVIVEGDKYYSQCIAARPSNVYHPFLCDDELLTTVVINQMQRSFVCRFLAGGLFHSIVEERHNEIVDLLRTIFAEPRCDGFLFTAYSKT